MIRVVAKVADGSFHLEVEGHAATDVCAAVSAITNTALLGLDQIALEHPDDLQVTIKENET